ncbi:uncharacterized protein [Asterias amurensis]
MRVSTLSALVGLTVGFCLGFIVSNLMGGNRGGDLFQPSSHRAVEIFNAAADRVETVLRRSPTEQGAVVLKHEPNLEVEKADESNAKKPRKILLDCGANVASTVLLFRETYPDGADYIIHSFEIDDRLAPYFSPYEKHHLHCPVGVAGKDGNMTAFSEMVWGPNKGKNNGADMQWGGGSLFVGKSELKDEKTGGGRKLSYRKTIPVIDLSKWIMETFTMEDYIIFKLDVEGAEYEILRKMISDKAFQYIDKFYGEYHDWQPTGWAKKDKDQIRTDVKTAGFSLVTWVGERRTYSDITDMNPVNVPQDTPGVDGAIYSNCEKGSISLVVAVGMNYKRANRVVATLAAYRIPLPITLFVYGDFAQTFPETVKSWAKHFTIGIREDGHNPPGHIDLMPGNWIRMALISASRRLEELGLKASYYLPTVEGSVSKAISNEAKGRGLRIVKPAVEFPAAKGLPAQLTVDNYYRFRDVERVPKALRLIHEALVKNNGGILSLDTDLPDTYMNSVFMMDYLVETSGFKMVPINECVAKSY